MSLFLGPIHYWLYNKIGNQEKLTMDIAMQAKEEGYIKDVAQYTKRLPDLETAIDGSNIHGWLQEQITDAESRFASLVIDAKNQGMKIEELQKIAFDFGKKNAPDNDVDAIKIYEFFESFFVNGMPCDHIHIVTEKSENLVSFEMTQDIHKTYWNEGEIGDYYKIRKSVMDGMLDNLNYEVITSDLYHYFIQKK